MLLITLPDGPPNCYLVVIDIYGCSEARVGKFDIAIERFLAVYDSICYYRRNNIFPDVMWNHIDPSVKEVISTYKELIESKDFDNLKWFISH